MLESSHAGEDHHAGKPVFGEQIITPPPEKRRATASWWPRTACCGMGFRIRISVRSNLITSPPTASRAIMYIAWNNSATVSLYSQGQTLCKCVKRSLGLYGEFQHAAFMMAADLLSFRDASSSRRYQDLLCLAAE